MKKPPQLQGSWPGNATSKENTALARTDRSRRSRRRAPTTAQVITGAPEPGTRSSRTCFTQRGLRRRRIGVTLLPAGQAAIHADRNRWSADAVRAEHAVGRRGLAFRADRCGRSAHRAPNSGGRGGGSRPSSLTRGPPRLRSRNRATVRIAAAVRRRRSDEQLRRARRSIATSVAPADQARRHADERPPTICRPATRPRTASRAAG